MATLDKTKLPQHLALIMDGNGRWAKKRLLPRNLGHQAGAKALSDIVLYCNEIGIKYLTVYAFSTENWKRSEEEVNYLMAMPTKYFNENKETYNKHNIKVSFIGTDKHLSEENLKLIKEVEQSTSQNTNLHLLIAFNYGARLEIVDAVKAIIESGYSKDDITEQLINDHLYTKGVCDVDLMIRTSGEKRLSNFLLWQNSYSEFYFTDTLWPDFKPKELEKILIDFSTRNRRFGGRKDA